jgi:hypothetical protein
MPKSEATEVRAQAHSSTFAFGAARVRASRLRCRKSLRRCTRSAMPKSEATELRAQAHSSTFRLWRGAVSLIDCGTCRSRRVQQLARAASKQCAKPAGVAA